MKAILWILSVIVCVVFVDSAKTLPSNVDQCYKGDDIKLRDCLLKNMKKIIKVALNGVPELKIPSLNPLYLSTVTLAADTRFKLLLKDVELYKINDLIIKDFNVTFNDNIKKWEIDIDVPHVDLISNYEIKGKLILLNLDGHGKAKGYLGGIHMKVIVEMETEKINGKDHLTVKSNNVTGIVDKYNLNFEDLFKNNVELSQRANEIINQNHQLALQEFIPVIRAIIKNLIDLILINLFKKYPEDVLFPAE